MTDTNFVALNVEKNGKALESFMLKINDNKIEDVLRTASVRSDPDLCLEYRLENGATKEEFTGKSFDEFKKSFGKDCKLSERPIDEKEFFHGKIAENMLTFRGEKTGERILNGFNAIAHETAHQKNALVTAYTLSKAKLLD